eukprot:gene17940-biopygen3899
MSGSGRMPEGITAEEEFEYHVPGGAESTLCSECMDFCHCGGIDYFVMCRGPKCMLHNDRVRFPKGLWLLPRRRTVAVGSSGIDSGWNERKSQRPDVTTGSPTP